MSQNLSKTRHNSITASLALAGPIAAILFFGSLIIFGLLRTDGFTHGTKAVSELGAVGAPNALAFNVLGFILPGMLSVVLAWALHRASGRKHLGVGIILLSLFGVCLAMAGVFQANMDDLQSTSSALHFIGAVLSGVFWTIAIFWLRPVLRAADVSARLVKFTPYFVIFIIAHLAIQVLFQTTGLINPGWGQRVGFLGVFIWFAWTGQSIMAAIKR